MLSRALCVAALGGVGALAPITTRLLARTRKCDVGAAAADGARSFVVGGVALGKCLDRAAAALESTGAFAVDATSVVLEDAPGDGAEERSARLAEVFDALRAADAAPCLRGWRDEGFALRESFHAQPLATIERAAAPLLGAPAFGVFCVGFTRDGAGRPDAVWLGRRSPQKPTWPNKWDVLAAGGVAAGDAPAAAMAAELADEAGLADADGLAAVGCVWYDGRSDDGWGVKPDTLFCYDLEVARDFAPTPADGEVEEFARVSVADLLDRLCADDDDWKPNSALVLVDFLVRHGLVSSDEADYVPLVASLRRRAPPGTPG